MNFIGQPMIEGPPPALIDSRPNAFDGRRLFRKVVGGLPVIAFASVAGLCIGCAALRLIPARYTSSASILIDPKRPGALGADTEFGNLYVDASKIANVEVLLLSSGFLQRVVQTEHLADDPAFGDATPSLLEKYLPFLATPSNHAALNTQTARELRAADRLAKMIRTGRIGVTYVIKIDVTGPTAIIAQGLAKAVADAYLRDQLTTKLDTARSDSAWLTARLQEQRKDLIRSEAAVEAIKKQFGVTGGDNTPDTTIDRQSIAQVNEQLVKVQGEVAAAAARYDQAQHVLHSGGNLEGLSDVAGSKVIGDLRKQQADASQRLADLSSRYASDHPLRKEAEQERDALSRQVSLEVARIMSGLENDYETALAHRDALKRQLASLVETVNAETSAEGRVELREAERVAEANRVAYEASLGRLREVQQMETRQDVEARIISEPEVPERPSFPKPSVILPVGGAFGLLLGLAAVLFLPITRAKIEDATSAERDFFLPVLGLAPFLRESRLRSGGTTISIPQYVLLNPFSRFAESLRILRLRLKTVGAGGARVVQITSSIPGEGKSTVAASIAISAAASGVRTVLVDLDLHHPAAGLLLGNNRQTGVTDVLMGQTTSDTALQTHATLPLTSISAGSIEAMHPGLLESPLLRELIAEFSRSFDLVILDTPPVLAISDPLYISELVDATVLVVAWRSTSQTCVDNALSALRSAGAPLAGLFINKVEFERNGRYGNNYGYERSDAM